MRRTRRLRPAHFIIAAQAATIVALTVLLIVNRYVQEAPRFRTLSNADQTLSSDAPLVRVAFDSNVAESEAATIAAEAGGSIVAGPSPNNVYTIVFRDLHDGNSLEGKVSHLRRHSHVLLAESINLELRH